MYLYAIEDNNGNIKEFGLLEIHIKNRTRIKNRVIKYKTTLRPQPDSKFYVVREISPTQDENGEWIQQWRIDELPLPTCKINTKKYLSEEAKKYIEKRLKDLDWGDTYEECLAELQSSATAIETKILYYLKPFKVDLTLTEIREKVSLYLASQYTETDLLTELQALNLTQAQIDEFMPLFASAVEVAELMYWVEEVWQNEEALEQQIDAALTIDEIKTIINSAYFVAENKLEGRF